MRHISYLKKYDYENFVLGVRKYGDSKTAFSRFAKRLQVPSIHKYRANTVFIHACRALMASMEKHFISAFKKVHTQTTSFS